MAKIPNTTLIPSIEGVREFTLNTYDLTTIVASEELNDFLWRLERFDKKKQGLVITTWQIDSLSNPGELRIQVSWQPA